MFTVQSSGTTNYSGFRTVNGFSDRLSKSPNSMRYALWGILNESVLEARGIKCSDTHLTFAVACSSQNLPDQKNNRY